MLEWIISNKETLKLIYALIVVFICLLVVLKADRMFRISLHQGIRYFRNAFLFYGLGFFTRYVIGSQYLISLISINKFFINGIFAFFLIMGGFFLLYSLIWKKIESEKKHLSSLVNTKIIIFYLMTLVIITLDFFWKTFIFTFISQIIIFSIAVIISFNNYIKKWTKGKFLKFYFVAMLLSLMAWLLNFVVALFFNWDQLILTGIYALNLIIFLIFLWGLIIVMGEK